MNGFDVGGSHKSQQTGYESFGIHNQNRVLNDGVDTLRASAAPDSTPTTSPTKKWR